MHRRVVSCALLSATVFLGSGHISSAQEPAAIQFSQFPAAVYKGRVNIPRGFHKDEDGAWRDDLDKLVAEPDVNFAGEYFLAAHSCGTSCRYYSLNNLRTGRDIGQISMFDAAEPAPRTKDGYTYIPILFYKPNSRLLIVQYELDLRTPEERNQCRQRYYLFEDGRFRAISKTLKSCTREGDGPE